MIGEPTVDEAVTAAREHGLMPDTVAEHPECVFGPCAVTVVMRDFWGNWIVCARQNDSAEWYVSGGLAEGGARGAASDYAVKGL